MQFDMDDTCAHSEQDFDSTTSTCMGCGIIVGQAFAPLSMNCGVLGGIYHHAFASPSAGNKKKNLAAAEAYLRLKGEIIDEKASSPPLTSPRTPKKRGRKPKNQQQIELLQSATEDIVVRKKSPSPSKRKVSSPSIRKKKNSPQILPHSLQIDLPTQYDNYKQLTKTMRALTAKGDITIAELAMEVFDDILLTGGYSFKDYSGGECFPCPKNVCKSYDSLKLQQTEILESFKEIVKVNSLYFSEHRRRVHVDVFVIALAAHILCIHGGGDDGVEECLDLERVRSRVRPSHSSSLPRSIIVGLCARTGSGVTSIPRLIEDAIVLAKKTFEERKVLSIV